MIMDSITWLHLLTPCILALSFLTLLPSPPSPESELPGIRPITIRVVTPRRGWILLALSLLAITSLGDCAVLIARIATAGNYPPQENLEGLPLAAEVIFAFGGFCIWGLTAIVIEWREKWGDKALTTLAVFGLVLEIPNLVFTVLRETKTDGSLKIFTILSIPPSALRLLILPILMILVSSPIVRFEPADESTGLLGSNGEPSRGRDTHAYGTFANEDEEEQDTSSDPNKAKSSNTTRTSSTAPVTPANGVTPKPSQPQLLKIPKNLGEIKKEDKPLTWREIGGRLKKLSPFLWPSTSLKLQLYVATCMVTLLIIRFANPLLPIALGQTVRSLTTASAGMGGQPWLWFGGYISLRFLLGGSGLLSFIQNVLWVPVSQYTDREMQLLCFNHLLNLSLAYHTKRNTGEVLKIIDRGSAINNLFQTMLFTAIPAVLDMIIAFAVFFYLYGPILAVVVTAVMIIYVTFSVTQMNYRMKRRRQMIDRDVKARGIVSDVLTNWESVKYFTAEQREVNRFTEAVLSYQEAEAKVSIGFQFIMLVQSFLLALGLSLGALIISFRILDGRLDAAEFIVFIQYYAQMQGPLDRFGWLYRILNQETTDAEKMFNLLAEATEVTDKPDAKELVVTDGVIEFDDVRFSYDGKVEALKGVSFKIGKGESMALVGESGSGKSTILRLLYRFYDITSGHIYIDGQDISQVTQLSLRRAIGIVPQDSVLWNDSIGANISYGKEGADDEEIIGAAKAARLHERILGFPEQYSTVVGERGVRLSGGEKQRVSLARMFLKSPAILVLDEATSALDTETEREIQKALAELAKGRSSLSIAHRLSTIINSDQIVVMKEGQVVEQGGYKELLDLNGAFATMWKKQIHTEAEILAQAEGVSPEQALLQLPVEPDLIRLDEDISKDNDDKPPGDAAEPMGAATIPSEPTQTAHATEPEGFDVKPEEDSHPGPSTYADAAKAPPAEDASIVAEDKSSEPAALETVLPEEPESTAVIPAPVSEDSKPSEVESAPEAPKTVESEEIEELREDKTAPATESIEHTPSRNSTAESTRAPTPRSNSVSDSPSASKRASGISFPTMASLQRPHLPTSETQRSDLSTHSTNSQSDLTKPNADEGKARKRLSSIKGFVRRISDQGLTRSNSTGGQGSSSNLASPGGGATGVTSPLADEATALISSNIEAPKPSNANKKNKKKKGRK